MSFARIPAPPSAPFAALLLAAVLLTGGDAHAQASSQPPAATAEEPPKPVPAVMARLAVRSLLLDAARAGDRLVAVGERGHILLSDDSGQSWRQVPSPSNSALTAVTFVTPQLGWAVGHDAVILHTADGGGTWTIQHWAPELEMPLMDIFFDSAQHGIAVGAYGLYLETNDGGKTWDERSIQEDENHLNAVVAPTADARLIAGEFGGIHFSLDRGATWTMLDSPYEGSFFHALALGPQEWLVLGLQGHVFRTEDGGQSWTQVETGTTAGLMGGTKLSDGRVILVGAAGNILTSSDGGRSFVRQQRDDRVALADVVEAPDGGIVLLTEQGILIQPAKPQ